MRLGCSAQWCKVSGNIDTCTQHRVLATKLQTSCKMKSTQSKQKKFLATYKIPKIGEASQSVFKEAFVSGIDWVDLRKRMQKK